MKKVAMFMNNKSMSLLLVMLALILFLLPTAAKL